ncbi:MAG: hypothetical protein ACE5JS_02975 [Nitrospinota bacterium]
MKIILGALVLLLLLGALEIPFASYHESPDEGTSGGCTSSSVFIGTMK